MPGVKKTGKKKSAGKKTSKNTSKKNAKKTIVHFPGTPVYELRVSLQDVRPPIWRQIRVPSHLKLNDLHKILQTVMGWENTHMHQFMKDGMFYVPQKGEFAGGEEIVYRNIHIRDILDQEKDSLIYEYDFGDGWTHKITLEKILPAPESTTVPECLAGKRSCPPENCGGPPGYAHLLEVMKSPGDPEYMEMMDWVGDGFDPESFDLDEINRALGSKNFGCWTLT